MTGPHQPLSPDVIARLLTDTDPYLSCDECFARIDEFVEQRLADPSYRDVPMDVHLAGCAVCAEEAETLTELLS
ncbi:hypothetical protein [Brevibacterium aurantiacum]|uniref:hypothetical protein n=1 Tax=Brevibacterium aurantiacum TaxID=273384 RepID=UPI001867018B|nr:hypothetical protein [Brevibacterium aurantiacum]